MPIDDLYWNAIDFGSDDSLPPEPSRKEYVDPWDLENYAYIRDQLENTEIAESAGSSSDFSAGQGGSSSGEFAEANSTSFYYVPAGLRKPLIPKEQLDNDDSLITEQSNYVAIDELKEYERNRIQKELLDSYGPMIRDEDFDSEVEDNTYEEGISSYVTNKLDYGHFLPSVSTTKTTRDRSISFSYGDNGYYPDNSREIYSKLDDYPVIRKDATLPIYEDDRLNKRKPKNFGLSNYGHLKIDYSYSWNNLDKYICN